jgi:hypothetical protein
VIGLQKTLTNNRIVGHLRNLSLWEKLLLQGLILAVVLCIVQAYLDGAEQAFLDYMPPIGFALLMFTTYFVQPLLLGFLNIALINTLYKTKGWQVGFWLNGVFLLLAFSTINLLVEMQTGWTFTPNIAAIDIVALSFPFGCLARFSNGGWKKPID